MTRYIIVSTVLGKYCGAVYSREEARLRATNEMNASLLFVDVTKNEDGYMVHQYDDNTDFLTKTEKGDSVHITDNTVVVTPPLFITVSKEDTGLCGMTYSTREDAEEKKEITDTIVRASKIRSGVYAIEPVEAIPTIALDIPVTNPVVQPDEPVDPSLIQLEVEPNVTPEEKSDEVDTSVIQPEQKSEEITDIIVSLDSIIPNDNSINTAYQRLKNHITTADPTYMEFYKDNLKKFRELLRKRINEYNKYKGTLKEQTKQYIVMIINGQIDVINNFIHRMNKHSSLP